MCMMNPPSVTCTGNDYRCSGCNDLIHQWRKEKERKEWEALERAKMEAREKPYREGLRTSQEGAAFMETRETRAPAQMHDMA